MTKDILIIGSQHGNETLGIRLFGYIKNFRPELLKSVDYYCANLLRLRKMLGLLTPT